MKAFFSNADSDVGCNTPMITIEKANRLLEERGQIVFNNHGSTDWQKWNKYEFDDNDSLKNLRGLLINIEPVNGDSAEAIVRDLLDPTFASREKLRDLIQRAQALREAQL